MLFPKMRVLALILCAIGTYAGSPSHEGEGGPLAPRILRRFETVEQAAARMQPLYHSVTVDPEGGPVDQLRNPQQQANSNMIIDSRGRQSQLVAATMLGSESATVRNVKDKAKSVRTTKLAQLTGQGPESRVALEPCSFAPSTATQCTCISSAGAETICTKPDICTAGAGTCSAGSAQDR